MISRNRNFSHRELRQKRLQPRRFSFIPFFVFLFSFVIFSALFSKKIALTEDDCGCVQPGLALTVQLVDDDAYTSVTAATSYITLLEPGDWFYCARKKAVRVSLQNGGILLGKEREGRGAISPLQAITRSGTGIGGLAENICPERRQTCTDNCYFFLPLTRASYLFSRNLESARYLCRGARSSCFAG